MENNLKKNKKKLDWRPQKKWKMTSKKKKKKEDDHKKKWNTNQSTQNNLIGCDTIVNSPSLF